ncbi:hypothetical protein TIFTF001_017083 [Ficus carica]|uniref:Uncharacterized protein n=1 Tax=Ficus carica TaxID=3494 RepID=A0AA88DAE4_FICCA|nr:hypothetical protein TIFTF001_017083 [Ficus carica]
MGGPRRGWGWERGEERGGGGSRLVGGPGEGALGWGCLRGGGGRGGVPRVGAGDGGGGAGAGAGSPVLGDHRGWALAAGRSPAMKKTGSEKDNIR